MVTGPRGPSRAEWSFGITGRERGGSKEGEVGRGLQREDPTGRGALRACPLSSLPQHRRPRIWGVDGPLVGQAPSSRHFISWADPELGLRGAGWIGLAEGTCSGGVEETRKPARSPSCAFCHDVGRLLGQRSLPRKAPPAIPTPPKIQAAPTHRRHGSSSEPPRSP